MHLRKDIWKERWVRGEPLSPEPSGQGRTYFARPTSQPEGQNSHVLKILKYQEDPERRRRLRLESATIRSLEHAGVASWADSNSDATHDDEELYLVTEYVRGPTLNALLDSGPQSVEDSISIVRGTLEALAYCHNQGAVHRDIKPDNIVLRDGDPTRPVLLDFGLTFNADLEPGGLNTPDHRAIGSKFLRLPEFDMQGPARLSPIVDVTCAVGVFLYLLTGEVPRVLRDEHGQMPHRRPIVRARLESNTRHILASLDSIFDVGFGHEQYMRWANCELLVEEIRRLQGAARAQPLSFSEEIRLLRKAMAENPTRRIEMQKKAIDDCCPLVADSVYQIFFQEVVGDIVLQNATRGRGDAFFRVDLVDAADDKRRVSLTIYRVFEGNEVAIVSRIKGKVINGMDGEKESDAYRINLFEPQLKGRVTEAVQRSFIYAWKHLGIPGR